MHKFHKQDIPHFTHVTVRVTSLQQSKTFYEDVIGLQLINHNKSFITLGSKGVPRITLLEADSPKTHTEGLYHIAFLLSDMTSLSRWLSYNINKGTSFIGASDHEVSHALYLEDPDGNGIEVYADTPESTWSISDTQIHMSTLPLNVQKLLALSNDPWTDNEQISIGHIHLRAKDIIEMSQFYQMLGMSQTFDYGSAKFLSFNGYHHHLGINNWGMARSLKHGHDDVDIEEITLYYPNDLKELTTTLVTHKVPFQEENGNIIIHDPIFIKLTITNKKESI